MKSIVKANVFLVMVVALLSTNWANAAGLGKNIVVLLAGYGTGTPGDDLFNSYGIPLPYDTADPESPGVTCFDMDLIDAKTGNVIGSGSDCLSNIAPTMTDNGLMMKMTATSFFHFPGGTLVSQGLVTVQPKLHGLTQYTHVVGAAPSPAENNVIYGDGKFSNAAGSVRLSGLVNLENIGVGEIDFDCLFIINLWN